MIVVDTSALMAVVLDERTAAACRDALEREPAVLISAGTLTETLIVAAGRNLAEEIGALVDGLGIEVVPVTSSSARASARAYGRWGKGHHRAALNFGDCFAYELATARACPLLFVGDDFSFTDVVSVL